MLHEKPVRSAPLGDDVDDGRSMAWKRVRQSYSDAPTPTAQDHQDPRCREDEDFQALSALFTGEDEEIKELFGPEVILSDEDEAGLAKLLPLDVPPRFVLPICWEDHYQQIERHGRLRIAYYKAVKPVSRHELKDPDAYSEDEIRQQNYFLHLQNEECFEWFFHPDDSWNPDFDDYQRISLKMVSPDCIGVQYPYVDAYRKRYHTYEMDAVYVKYYGELSKKIKWIQAYLHLDETSAEWEEIYIRGWRQALRIATQLPNVTLSLFSLAYDEYIDELREDASLKDLDVVYFLIWRSVVRDNKTYMEALKKIYEMDKFHVHKRVMETELNKGPVFVTMRQQIFFITERVGISVNTEDSEAQGLFGKGLAHFKTKYMVNYAEKKLEIAKRLNWHKSIDIPGRVEPEPFKMA